ncbi:MAG: hypothetical protein H7329_15440 [Opitutaceae bacterium]|nr:hypothetical protein [Cytophagales bacterium]
MSIRYIVCLISLCAFVLSCKKKTEESVMPTPVPVNETKYGKAGLHLHYYVGNIELDTLSFNHPVNQADTGRKISLGYGQFYLSDFEYINNDGSVFALPNGAVLKKGSFPTYVAGNIPVGIYKGIRFKVGLKPELDTSISSPTLNDPAMLFGSKAQGHIYVNIQGKIDTTSNATGTLDKMQPFSYKIGTSLHLTSVTNLPPTSINVMETGVEYLHIVFDLKLLFKGVQLNNPGNLSVNSLSDNNSAVAAKIAANIPNSFRFE